MHPTLLVAYLAIFATVGFLSIFVTLSVGWLLRAKMPTPEKQEVYECGELPIGSSFIQFDLRFYVVALLFIVLDVEVAFFFPWATVFGKSTHLMDTHLPVVVSGPEGGPQLTPAAAQRLHELGVPRPAVPDPAAGIEDNDRVVRGAAGRLALAALADISVFFGVLLVGFAYVWYRGDLNWVRATTQPSVETEKPREKATLVNV